MDMGQLSWPSLLFQSGTIMASRGPFEGRQNRDSCSKEKRQTVCKPGSVLLAAETTRIDGHSSGTPVAGRLSQPTRTAARKPACRTKPACRPYLVLLPVGFALPPPFPAARCALTAPFHPYPPSPKLSRAVYFLWHFPWGRPRRALPGTVSPWSPDFPPPHTRARRRPSDRLAGKI